MSRFADEIADIWFHVGLELDLKKFKLRTIELNRPNNNERAALDMLMKWKQEKNNPPRRVLLQAIEKCSSQAKRGIYLCT